MKTTNIQIKVGRKQIDNALSKDSHHCMIADGIKEAIPEAQYILVDLQSIRFTVKAKRKRYTFLTPPKVQKELISFDQGKASEIAPFQFTLREPKVRKMGWIGQRSANSSRKTRKYNKTGKKHPNFSKKEREFGIRLFV